MITNKYKAKERHSCQTQLFPILFCKLSRQSGQHSLCWSMFDRTVKLKHVSSYTRLNITNPGFCDLMVIYTLKQQFVLFETHVYFWNDNDPGYCINIPLSLIFRHLHTFSLIFCYLHTFSQIFRHFALFFAFFSLFSLLFTVFPANPPKLAG